MVQWLRLHASNAECTSLIPDGGTKIPHSIRCSKNFFVRKKILDLHPKYKSF